VTTKKAPALLLLPIGAKVVVQGTHTGYVAGYGFTSESVPAYGNGQDVATRPCYLVQLDEMIVVKRRMDGAERDEITAAVSVLVAHPDNVKEAKDE